MKLWLLIRSIFNPDIVWEYGTCSGRIARKHKITGHVQFILWRKGEQGYEEDYWHDMHDTWWTKFNKH